MKKIYLSLLLILAVTHAWSQGFSVSGTSLIDANGNNFIMKGINVPLAWFIDDVNNNIANIRNRTGANTLRIVVGTETSDDAWQTCVQKCINNDMIPMVELHDVTGNTDARALNRMAQFWASKASFLTRPDIARYILINIANEWGDWNMATNNPGAWNTAYRTAITTIRNAGINTTLVVDAPNYGQDRNNGNTIRTYASDLQSYDPRHNLLFSVHMYCEWGTSGSSSINSGLPSIKNAGIPIIVGEFGYQHSEGSGTCDIDESLILSTCQSNGIGWLAWSWKGNGSPVQYLDLSYDWAGTSLTSWGNTVINGANGTKTAQTASVFNQCSPTAITPYIQVNDGEWQEASGVTVNPGDEVKFGPQPSGEGSWSWNGGCGTSGTSREQIIYPTGDCDVIATYTNSCGAQSTQAFQIRISGSAGTVPEGTYSITARHSGKVLDVTGAGTRDGTNVEQWTNYSSTNQQWILTDVGSGYYRVSPVHDSSKALDVNEASTADETNVQIWSYGNGSNQQWEFLSVGDGYYQLKDRNSGKCLDVSSSSNDDGANIQIWPCNSDSYNQQWTFSTLKRAQSTPEELTIEDSENNDVLFYPNPFTTEAEIRIDNPEQVTSIVVTDMAGKQMEVINHANVKNIQTVGASLKTGVYILQVYEGNKKQTFKIVKK
jgi:mannan endo-1,4-beta-mannosidase